MLISYARKFKKQYQKADFKIKEAFKVRLKIFKENPTEPLLNNHSLTGKFSGQRSINITGDWRAIYSETIKKNEPEAIIFEALGTHSQLYK